jgi:hypothetical protein
MEGYFSTGQSPQWVVVPMEEEEEDDDDLPPISKNLKKITHMSTKW